jgi:hypothetical protein
MVEVLELDQRVQEGHQYEKQKAHHLVAQVLYGDVQFHRRI